MLIFSQSATQRSLSIFSVHFFSPSLKLTPLLVCLFFLLLFIFFFFSKSGEIVSEAAENRPICESTGDDTCQIWPGASVSQHCRDTVCSSPSCLPCRESHILVSCIIRMILKNQCSSHWWYHCHPTNMCMHAVLHSCVQRCCGPRFSCKGPHSKNYFATLAF